MAIWGIIPTPQDVIDGIKWLIDNFFQKAPKTFLLIFFLFLIAIASLFLSAIFHLIGYHCYSGAGTGLEVVKVETTEFKTNWQIWTSSNDYVIGNTLTVCEAHPEMCGKESFCYGFVMYNSSYGYWQRCNPDTPDPSCLYILKTEYGCNNCTEQERCFEEGFTSIVGAFGICTYTLICDYNETATGLPDVPSGCASKYQAQITADNCWIPPNFYWDTSTGTYICSNLSLCGSNATIQQNKRINQLINSVGYTKVYPQTLNDKNIDRFIYLKCNQQLNPEITVYGFPILNYRVWVLLFLIVALITFLFKLGQQHL
jgi:hypothetical protein